MTSKRRAPTTRPKGTTKASRRRERDRRRFIRNFLSDERVALVKTLPCVACEAGMAGGGGPIENHHEPPKGRSGYRAISPLCLNHHSQRHGLNSGVETFWQFGITYQAANAATEAAWQGYCAGCAY